jgi:dTDP-4-dehydrorhamnose reductase
MKIVITGAGGRLGAALLREYRGKFETAGFDRAQLDLANLDEVRRQLMAIDFDVLINAAAFTSVDLCESQREQAFLINAEAPCVLAEICRDKDAKLIHFSTDYVFDGEKREPYTEEDKPRPISVYAESKRAGEENVLAMQDRSTSAKAAADRHLVVRVSWVFGPDRPSFVDAMIKRAREEEHIDAIADKFSAPTYTADIAKMLERVLADWSRHAAVPDGLRAGRLQGILHFANAGECSWQEYAQFALDCCRSFGVPLKAKAVGAIKLRDMKTWVARRPVYSVLSTAKYIALTGTAPRNWRDAVGEYLKDFYFQK